MHSTSSRPGRVALATVFVVVAALQTFTTRGEVLDVADRPIAGADVLLASGSRVVARARTDRTGQFRFVHGAIDRSAHTLLLCARGHDPMVTSPAASAILHTTYGLDTLPGGSTFWTPARMGWKAETPPSCPVERRHPARAADARWR